MRQSLKHYHLLVKKINEHANAIQDILLDASTPNSIDDTEIGAKISAICGIASHLEDELLKESNTYTDIQRALIELSEMPCRHIVVTGSPTTGSLGHAITPRNLALVPDFVLLTDCESTKKKGHQRPYKFHP